MHHRSPPFVRLSPGGRVLRSPKLLKMLEDGKSVAVLVQDNSPRQQERFLCAMRQKAMKLQFRPSYSAVLLGPGGGGGNAQCDWRFGCDKALRFGAAGELDAGGTGTMVSMQHASHPRHPIHPSHPRHPMQPSHPPYLPWCRRAPISVEASDEASDEASVEASDEWRLNQSPKFIPREWMLRKAYTAAERSDYRVVTASEHPVHYHPACR